MNQNASLMEEQKPKPTLEAFLKQLETLPSPEDKLKESIAYMREALSQEGAPFFKGFWEVRKFCLPLFKESLIGNSRAQLWNDYIELTREGRRLKNLLDEESAFAIEQIDLAIIALENEVTIFAGNAEDLLKTAPPIEFARVPKTLEKKLSSYKQLQSKLNFLNVLAIRINGLRKELIKTEMRIRQKNKFFQQLSAIGDKVFPLRKELLQDLSTDFLGDVAAFVDENFGSSFSPDEIRRSVFFFREEIKNYQALAKELTLNTQAFSKTRLDLSDCWEKLKGMEKELKKEFAEQKQKSSENVEEVKKRIQAFEEEIKENKMTAEEGFKRLDEISYWMRGIELTRNDVRFLKELIQNARLPFQAQQDEKEQERKQKEVEFEKVRREKIELFQNELKVLKDSLATESAQTLSQKLEECKKNLTTLSVTKVERQGLERLLKGMRDQISEKQEHALLELSEDDRATLESLEEVLEQRKERRKEVKDQIEDYRKIMGGSALDFEKAIKYNELMAVEKERLAKFDEGIAEIEKKIRSLKKKI